MNSLIQQRFTQLQDGVQQLRVCRDLLRRRASTSQEEETRLQYRADLHQKCAEIIKVWLEDSLQSNVNSIAELATSGLRHIITDQALSFQIQQEQKYNRVSMRFAIDDNGVVGDPIDSFGGGAVLIISFIMRLAVMARMNMGNLLLLDESMSALANKYVPNAASFMRQLADKTGVNILMVTHNDEFIEHAHLAYEGEKIVGKSGAEELHIQIYHGVR